MSMDEDKIYINMKKPLQHRGNDDVFDLSSSTLYRRGWRAAPGYGTGPRMSLDMPNMMRGGSSLSSSSSILQVGAENKQFIPEKKKQKQPSSPGGRLASFLNSLFSQSLIMSRGKNKKKSTKSSSGGTQSSMKDIDDEIRRKRRSSISHFGSSATTPIKTMSLPTTTSTKVFLKQPSTEVADHDYSWLQDDEKLHWDTKQRINNYANGYNLEKKDHNHNHKILNKKKNHDLEKDQFSRFHDQDGGGGGDSDSSSDLFELQNYDLGYDHSCGLPVYETTHMDNIKRPSAMVGSTT